MFFDAGEERRRGQQQRSGGADGGGSALPGVQEAGAARQVRNPGIS